MTDAAVILELEARFWEAAGDPDFYRANLADHAVMVFPVGVLTKDDVVAAVTAAAPWIEYTIEHPLLVPLAEDVCSLTYTTVARRDTEYRAAVTSVYLRVDGRWLLALHQQTPLP
jgi:hypothetical protein